MTAMAATTPILDAQSLHIDDLLSNVGWWAIYTRHQHERAVADMLITKEFEVFLPLYQTLRQWKDRRKAILMPLFPGYLFVREKPGVMLHILTTPGTNMVLTCGQHLAVIPNHDIQAIRRALVDPSRVEPHPFLTCGERVRVVRGSLEGVEGQAAADITARDVIVLGKVCGNVVATDSVNVRAEGAVIGDLLAPRIIIEDGAFIKGAIYIRKSVRRQGAN